MAYKDPKKQKANSKAYRKANPDKMKSRHKAWAEAHPEKIKEWGRIYRKANKLRLNAKCKAWRKANPEKMKAFNKIYREINAEKEKARVKAYHKANPEKGREFGRKRWALKHTTQVESINEKEVYLRDSWKCQICHKREHKTLKYPNPICASLDHIIPLSKGGTHTYKNVQLAHFGCNASKGPRVISKGEQMSLF